MAAASLALFAFTTLRRVGYPFALEWMESGSYDSLVRLLDNERLYDRPSLEFVPYNYTPLYYIASAAMARLSGVGFASMRLVSLLAACGTMLLIFHLVRRAGAGRFPAIAGAITFGATYALTGSYMDTARPDSLFVLLLTGGLAFLMAGERSRASSVLAGLLFAAAYFTKQSTLPCLGLLLVYLLVRRSRVGLGVLAGLLATTSLGVSLAMHGSNGWYGYYTLEVATGYALRLSNLPHFFAKYLAPLTVSVLFAGAWLGWPARERTRSDQTLFIALASIVLGCFWLTLYPGTAPNVALPAAMACSVALGLGLDAVLTRARSLDPPHGARLTTLVYAAIVLQWVGLLYDPTKLVPDSRDVAAGWSLVRKIAATPGDVLIPNHGYLGRLAGKPGQAHALALANAVQGDRRGAARAVAESLDTSVARGRYSLLILDDASAGARDPIPGYGPPQPCFSDRDVFWTRAGSRTRPEFFRYRLDRGDRGR